METKNKYEGMKDVTPSYSRSGGRVLTDGKKFYVPRMDDQYPEAEFETLELAWRYCEGAYYSWN